MSSERALPGEAEVLLDALHRFFLWSYHEAIQRDYPLVHTVFPLSGSSRLDLVHVPGSGRVHFVYSLGDGAAHRVFVRSLSLGGWGGSEEDEKSSVSRYLTLADVLVHFVVDPPFEERFDRVRKLAVEAAASHARSPVRRQSVDSGFPR